MDGVKNRHRLVLL